MKLQTTIRGLLLATAWIAVGICCLRQMRFTDVVQFVEYANLPDSDERLLEVVNEFSTEDATVRRDQNRVTLRYARRTTGSINPDVDWEGLGYSGFEGGGATHVVRTRMLGLYIAVGFAYSIADAWLSRRRSADSGIQL